MTIEKWLSDVYQDSYVGNKIWNKVSDGGSEMVADIRGWGAIQYLFKTNEEAKNFQNEICKFIVEAIREKIERLSEQETLYTEEQVRKALSESFKASQEGYNITSDEIIQSLKPKKD
jgi:lipoate-protein ligase A